MQTTISRPKLRLIASDGEILPPPASASLAEKLLDFALRGRTMPNRRVIEFTFGPGRLAWRFLADGCDVVSVDLAATPSHSMPEDWLGAFDLAITTCALHQVADPARLLGDVSACVRPGGACAGLEPSHEDFDSLDVHGCAATAGLSLFQAEQQTRGSALFWRAQVPGFQSLTPPSLGLAA